MNSIHHLQNRDTLLMYPIVLNKYVGKMCSRYTQHENISLYIISRQTVRKQGVMYIMEMKVKQLLNDFRSSTRFWIAKHRLLPKPKFSWTAFWSANSIKTSSRLMSWGTPNSGTWMMLKSGRNLVNCAQYCFSLNNHATDVCLKLYNNNQMPYTKFMRWKL